MYLNEISDEPAIVIFTTGDKTDVKYFGESKTGTWKLDLDKQINDVIIYHRDETKNINMLYKGSFVRTEPSNDNRNTIIFDNVECIGETSYNWFGFTGNNSSTPIKYINI